MDGPAFVQRLKQKLGGQGATLHAIALGSSYDAAVREAANGAPLLPDPTFPSFEDSYAFDPLQPMPMRDDPLGPGAQATARRNFAVGRQALTRSDWTGATTAFNACIAYRRLYMPEYLQPRDLLSETAARGGTLSLSYSVEDDEAAAA